MKRFTSYSKQTPSGTVRVSGAKNSATRLLAASLLADRPVVLDNFPTELVDANVKLDFIRAIGGNVTIDHDYERVLLEARFLTSEPLDHYDYPIRTTYLLVAGQLRRNGIARIPYPGGCRIGVRKYDLHIMVWEALGAQVEEKEDHIEVRAKKLVGREISFPISTVGGTENAILCGCIATGATRIKNAYITPEIIDLIELLRRLGAQIEVHGGSEVIVEGVSEFHSASHRVMSDRIEALTWMVYAAVSKGSITVLDVPISAMTIPLHHLRHAGIDYYQNSSGIRVDPSCLEDGVIQPFEVACGTHPGVISDMQPLYVILALFANGNSRIFDYRYPDRTRYLEEVSKFCPGILAWDSAGSIRVEGPAKLVPATADSTDLRGSIAAILAALLADGASSVNNVEMALRGYNKLSAKLSSLGINFELTEHN